MKTLNRTTNSAPLLVSFSIPKKNEAEKECYQIHYDDEMQIVYYMGGGGSTPPPQRTHSKKYGSWRGTSGDNCTPDAPHYGQDD